MSFILPAFNNSSTSFSVKRNHPDCICRFSFFLRYCHSLTMRNNNWTLTLTHPAIRLLDCLPGPSISHVKLEIPSFYGMAFSTNSLTISIRFKPAKWRLLGNRTKVPFERNSRLTLLCATHASAWSVNRKLNGEEVMVKSEIKTRWSRRSK